MKSIGFVLINVFPGKEKEVFNTISKLDELLEIYPLFGDYDILAKICAGDYEILSNIIVTKIRSIKGITETKTLPMAKF